MEGKSLYNVNANSIFAGGKPQNHLDRRCSMAYAMNNPKSMSLLAVFEWQMEGENTCMLSSELGIKMCKV